MERQYAVSERAHFMCPQMHFGMALEMKQTYRSQDMEAVWQKLIKAHPFLRAHMAYEEGTGRLYYDVGEESTVTVTVCKSRETVWNDYASVGTTAWDVLREGLLKVFVYPDGETLLIMLVAHHLLTDGVGLMNLALEFAGAYAGGKEPEYAEERLIAGIEELPKGSALSGISRMLVRYANRKWKKENSAVEYERYLEFSKNYGASHRMTLNTYDLDEKTLNGIYEKCRENGVTVNDWLLAETFVRTGTGKIVMAADVRDSFADYRKGALGNYATAFSVVCRSKTRDVWEKAREVHKLVAEIRNDNRRKMLVLACYFEMEPGLLDAAAISALGGFQSRAATFVGRGMFGFGGSGSYSVTNLGRVESEYVSSLRFIPPASPAAKATIGVVTLNNAMYVCLNK